MSGPYTPTSFSAPIFNPAVGGSGTPYPYISNSEYLFAPTAVDTNNLVPGGNAAAQAQSLANTIRRSSAWADRIVYGADPASKGASLCATLSVETGVFPVLRGALRLTCDYRPIIQVNGVDIGPNMGSLTSVGSTVASNISIGRRTIYVPLRGFTNRSGDSGSPSWAYGLPGKYQAVWSYVNGYPHTQLAADVDAEEGTCTVLPTDGGTGLLGILPGTQMTIVDGSLTERFTVASVSGTTITSTAPFLNDHVAPSGPDFVPVTTVPDDVGLAVILLTTALIKTEGDSALVLAGMVEPKEQKESAGGMTADVELATKMLRAYRVNLKTKV